MTDYSKFVESLIITSGMTRKMENTLGLIGEFGEVAELIKKGLRDGHEVDKANIRKELGDVVFYAVACYNLVDQEACTKALNLCLAKAAEIEFDGMVKEELEKCGIEPKFVPAATLGAATETLVDILEVVSNPEWNLGTNTMRDGFGNLMAAIAIIAHLNGTTLNEVVTVNRIKLEGRKERGTIQGSGNDR